MAASETGIRSASTPASRFQALGEQQQQAYIALLTDPSLVQPVLGKLPASVRADVQANLDASNELSSIPSTPNAPKPHWTIVQPPPADTLMGYYAEAQQRYHVPWQYLAAINLVETHMGRIHGNSPAGAQGPMQFMPSTWSEYGQGDINDPHAAILAAARYLAAAGAPQDMSSALFAYNHSHHYVRAIQLYAGVMQQNRRAYYGYYWWDVYIETPSGLKRLSVGDTT